MPEDLNMAPCAAKLLKAFWADENWSYLGFAEWLGKHVKRADFEELQAALSAEHEKRWPK